MRKMRIKAIIFAIFAVLLCLFFSGCDRKEEPINVTVPSQTELKWDTPYIDNSAYYGMLQNGDDLFFLPYEMDRLDKLDFGAESFEKSCDMVSKQGKRLSGTGWTGAIYDGVLYHSAGNLLCTVDLKTGENAVKSTFLDNFKICGTYKEDGVGKLLVSDEENGKIHICDINTGEIQRSYDLPESNFFDYMVSDKFSAYFADSSQGKIWRFDFETGAFREIVQSNMIATKRPHGAYGGEFRHIVAFHLNRAEIYGDYLYFMVTGTRYGLYRVPKEGGAVKEVAKSGFLDEITAFCISDGIIYTAVQHSVSGELGEPATHRGTYSVFTFDPITFEYEQISEEAEIAGEIEGIVVENGKALVFGGNQTFFELR